MGVNDNKGPDESGHKLGPLRLGVTVPLANEERTVVAFLERVCAQLSPDDRVFCVLDRSSRDNTKARVEEYHETDRRVTLVWSPENACVVDAYFAGYRAALDARCRWILEMDGGFSHLPEQIPQFVAAMQKGYDFAAGSRFTAGGRFQGRPHRCFVSRLGGILANLVLRCRMTDMTSGFECFTRRAMQRVVDRGVRSRQHFFQTEIRYMLHDWKWTEIPIRYANPSTRLGTSSLFEALRNLWPVSYTHLRPHET